MFIEKLTLFFVACSLLCKLLLPEDILHECWSKESLEQAAEEEKTEEKKRVLLVDKRNNVENILIILEDIKEHFLPDNQ